jgi:hypothetical protein
VSLTAPAPTTGSVPVSINGPTHPEHHPGPHAGMALGFPMTGHEVGAALAVAVVSFGCGRRTCGQRSDSVRTAPPVTVEPPQPPRETP